MIACPKCTEMIPEQNRQGSFVGGWSVTIYRCDRCRLTVQIETSIDYDDDSPPEGKTAGQS